MKEDQLKQERRQNGQKQLAEWAQERNLVINGKRQENERNAQDQAELTKAKAGNPWERVIDNCEMDPSVYSGTADVTRMRQVMISRKADLAKKK